jgi:hypothetical protein
VYDADAAYERATHAYRALASDSVFLDSLGLLEGIYATYYDAAAMTNIGELERIDRDLGRGDTTAAQQRNDGLVPQNNYEAYTRSVNTVLTRVLGEQIRLAADSAFGGATGFAQLLRPDERTFVHEVATGLVGTYGPAVYTARVLLDTVIDLQAPPAIGLREEQSKTLLPYTLHPNPARDQLTLQGVLKVGQRVEVRDALGRFVLKLNVERDAEGVSVPLSGLAAGVYMIYLRDGGATLYQDKVVLIRP